MASIDCLIERLCRTLELPKACIVAEIEDNRHSLVIPPDRSITIGQVQGAVARHYENWRWSVGPYGSITPTTNSCSLEVRDSRRHLARVIRIVLSDGLDIKIEPLPI